MSRLARTALGVVALYLTVWPHELGHSIAAFCFGCKADWWRTDMSIFLWSSWAGKVDYRCLESKGVAALGVVDFAGIAVNLVLLAFCPLLGRWWRSAVPASRAGGWVFLGTVWWAWANVAEAFSYLTVNTAWLASDMKTVVVATGVNHWVWFVGAVISVSVVVRSIWRPTQRAAEVLAAPESTGRWVAMVFPAYAVIAGGVMAVARIVLT